MLAGKDVFRWNGAGQVYVQKGLGRQFQIYGSAAQKLQMPSEVQTNETENRLMLDNLRERVEWWACKAENK